MNKSDFLITNKNTSLSALAANPIVWSVIDALYHSKRMHARIGNIDPHKKFVSWLSLNPAIFYRMVRLAFRISKKENRRGIYELDSARI